MRRYSFLRGAATALLVVRCAATVAFAKTPATHPATDKPKDVFAHLKLRNTERAGESESSHRH